MILVSLVLSVCRGAILTRWSDAIRSSRDGRDAELFVARESDHATIVRDPAPDMMAAILEFVRLYNADL